jgi:pimeloyl-ACP methyl ester carboxylesterase
LQNREKPKSFKYFESRKRNEVTANTKIPIGIFNSETIILTQDQVEENIKAKENKKKPKSDDYEQVDILFGALMQSEIFDGTIQIEISDQYFSGNSKEKIKYLEIDFQEGDGYQKINFKNEIITYKFKSIGLHNVAIKLATNKETTITNCSLNVHFLERPKINYQTDIQAEKTINEKTPNGKILDNVTGGSYRIYNGCDNVFDKPIIIAEGFDINEDVSLDDILAKYYPNLYAFRNNGYDLVILNYNNGRDYIQNNAEVLKRVINEVNTRKIGNNKLVVVGESMSGLVARWALRTMENSGQTHNVSHFISFDSPHLGANVPPGLIAIREDFENIAGPLAKVIGNLAFPALNALRSPAGKQLLFYVNSGGLRDPLFNQLRTDFNSLGNGGYPNQAGIKNIAMLNGSLTGTNNTTNLGSALNPGSKLLDYQFVFIACNGVLQSWSNNINQNTKIYQGFTSGFIPVLCNYSFSTKYATIPTNYDNLPGGFNQSNLPDNFFLSGTVTPKFCFVPTFSSIDYRGPLTGPLNINIQNTIINANNQVIRPDLTPFQAIYGPIDDNNTNVNSFHSFSNDVSNINAWNRLAQIEFGVNSNVVANSCILPTPLPIKEIYTKLNGTNAYKAIKNSYCKRTTWFGKIFSDRTIRILSTLGYNRYDNYIETLSVIGNGATIPVPGPGGIYAFDYRDYPNGTYTFVTRRTYFGLTLGQNTISTSSQFTITNCNGGRFEASCPIDEDEGELIGVLNDVKQNCFATKYNGLWIATLADGTFVPRCRLIANGLDFYGANCFAENDPTGAPTATCGSVSRKYVVNNTYNIQSIKNNTNWSGADNLAFGLKAVGWAGSQSPQADENYGENYGEVLKGYIKPLATGTYTFWLASDDQSEFYLSADNSPNNKAKIAHVNSWTFKNEWAKEANQKSAQVFLTAGQSYYFELWHIEGGGGDHAEVAWSINNTDPDPKVIPSSVLLPYAEPSSPTGPQAAAGGICIYNVSIPSTVINNQKIATWSIVGGTAPFTFNVNGYTWTNNDGTSTGINLGNSFNLTLTDSQGKVGVVYLASGPLNVNGSYNVISGCANTTTPPGQPIVNGLCMYNVSIPATIVNNQKIASWQLNGGSPPYTFNVNGYTWSNNDGLGTGINLGNSFNLTLTDVNGKSGSIFLNAGPNNVNGSFQVLNGCVNNTSGRLAADLENVPFENTNTFWAYPSPATSKINFKWNLKLNETAQYLLIYSIDGKEIYKKVDLVLNKNTIEIEIEKLPYGLYIANLKSTSGNYFYKFSKAQ